jgi:hypothetical protein
MQPIIGIFYPEYNVAFAKLEIRVPELKALSVRIRNRKQFIYLKDRIEREIFDQMLEGS